MKARYYSDQEAAEILRLYREACKAALRQVKQHLADGHAFGHTITKKSESFYGAAACAVAFEFKGELATAEIVEPVAGEIGEGGE